MFAEPKAPRLTLEEWNRITLILIVNDHTFKSVHGGCYLSSSHIKTRTGKLIPLPEESMAPIKASHLSTMLNKRKQAESPRTKAPPDTVPSKLRAKKSKKPRWSSPPKVGITADLPPPTDTWVIHVNSSFGLRIISPSMQNHELYLQYESQLLLHQDTFQLSDEPITATIQRLKIHQARVTPLTSLLLEPLILVF